MARILLAEDDDNLRRFLTRALTKAGHDVESVGDGEAALGLAKEESFDLLVADVVMPGLDGIELARRASALLPDLRVMFITGFAAVAMSRPYATKREPKILQKPFHLRQLVDEVTKVLRG